MVHTASPDMRMSTMDWIASARTLMLPLLKAATAFTATTMVVESKETVAARCAATFPSAFCPRPSTLCMLYSGAGESSRPSLRTIYDRRVERREPGHYRALRLVARAWIHRPDRRNRGGEVAASRCP